MHRVEVCCFQETKLSEISQPSWREIGGSKLDHFCFSPANGTSGSMVIGWNSSLRKGRVVSVGSFCLSVEFTNLCDHSTWLCTTVYGPNLRHLKPSFWEKLRNCHTDMPWVICGDFNAIFLVEDKNIGIPNLTDIRSAQSLVCDLNLVEPPLVGRKFTWTNGQSDPIWVHLDRFLVNQKWLDVFSRVHQTSLPRLGSDHVPLRLEAGSFLSKGRPFRFEQFWYSEVGITELISVWWNETCPRGCGAFILANKLKFLKAKLRVWSKLKFGALKSQKLELLHTLDLFDQAKESRSLSPAELLTESNTHDAFSILLKQEEIYWKQRSRALWVKEGDNNTKFFHAVANGRRNHSEDFR